MLRAKGDGIQGEAIICQYRKADRAALIHLTGGHRGWRQKIQGYPAIAVIDREWLSQPSP